MTDAERRAIEQDCERLIKLYVNLNDAQDWPAVAAGTTIFLIPILVFTILLRKQLLRGITFGAVRK